MKRQIDVVIIFYMSGTTKKYIASVSRNFSGKILPQYSENCFEAFRCEDDQHADTIIGDILNSGSHQFRKEWITVDKEQVVKYGSMVKKETLS